MAMNLVYNPSTGHVKLGGAVIGTVSLGPDGVWCYTPYSFRSPSRVMLDPDRGHLLARVREALETPTKVRSTDTPKGD